MTPDMCDNGIPGVDSTSSVVPGCSSEVLYSVQYSSRRVDTSCSQQLAEIATSGYNLGSADTVMSHLRIPITTTAEFAVIYSTSSIENSVAPIGAVSMHDSKWSEQMVSLIFKVMWMIQTHLVFAHHHPCNTQSTQLGCVSDNLRRTMFLL
jgi:hypothetical protein